MMFNQGSIDEFRNWLKRDVEMSISEEIVKTSFFTFQTL